MNTVLLNNVDHAELRVAPLRGPAVGDAINQVVIAPSEFQTAQRDFPIFFRKDDQDDWQAVALLGFAEGENLYLDGDRWMSRYVPAMLARGPFSIGLNGSGETAEPMIHIDLDHPGVGQENGFPLFREQGGSAPFLEHISQILRTLHAGMAMRQPFFEALERLDLIEPVDISSNAASDLQFVVKGFSTINQEKLSKLDAKALHPFHTDGHLFMAHLVIASLANMPDLIDLKRRAHSAQTAS